MTLVQTVKLISKVVRYNLKIVFAGKFIWFMLAALGFFIFFLIHHAWKQDEINEALIYNILLLPCVLLIFYPAVFGIQNDADNRILEIVFGIPNYKYKVWGIRLLMMYGVIFLILLLFSVLATYLLYPVSIWRMSLQLLFPVLFLGNLSFMLSTVMRSGNGTAVLVIILGIALLFLSKMNSTPVFWDVLLNPFNVPDKMHPMIWENLLLKNRIFLFFVSIVSMMMGLLNLQKRERFV